MLVLRLLLQMKTASDGSLSITGKVSLDLGSREDEDSLCKDTIKYKEM